MDLDCQMLHRGIEQLGDHSKALQAESKMVLGTID